MAVQGSGLGKGFDGASQDRTSFDARSGAAKTPQTTFPIKSGMKDMTEMSRVGPGATSSGEPNPAYHFGPDASSANPSDPQSPGERGKTLRRQPGASINADGVYDPNRLQSTWGMKDANGKGVDNDIGGKVLGEAILSGASSLPASTSEKSGAGPKSPG